MGLSASRDRGNDEVEGDICEGAVESARSMESVVSIRIGSEDPASGLTDEWQFPVSISPKSRRSNYSSPLGPFVPESVQVEMEAMTLALRVSRLKGSTHLPGGLSKEENRSCLLTGCPLDDAESVRLASPRPEEQAHPIEERAAIPVPGNSRRSSDQGGMRGEDQGIAYIWPPASPK